MPERYWGEMCKTNPSGQSSPGGGNWPFVIRRSTGTAPPFSTRRNPLDHDVGAESFEGNVRLDRQGHPRITSNVAELQVIRKVPGDNLVPIPADIDAGHLGSVVGVDRGKMNEPPGDHGGAGVLVEPNGTRQPLSLSILRIISESPETTGRSR